MPTLDRAADDATNETEHPDLSTTHQCDGDAPRPSEHLEKDRSS